ncbi:MAG: hypothetical protein JSW54_05520 [Fidelibacterota bacterium]|nr:MAG: hypothetical protein JSW54_05520 [Candidatus Neomarinimicrobiota bacterium]
MGQPPAPDRVDWPDFREFPVTSRTLYQAVEQAVRSSEYGLEIDTQHSTPATVITKHQPLSRKALRKLAFAGTPGIKGRVLYADFHVQFSIRSSFSRPEYSRVTVEPVFMVYLSRWGDHRQWIQWRSNGVVELDLLASIEIYLQSGN